MPNSTDKPALEVLLKTTEENRKQLQKAWKKVEDLDAAIQSAQSDQLQRKQAKKSN